MSGLSILEPYSVAKEDAMRLKGASVIVTGASAGIGRESAREFGRAGANVTLVARRQAQLETLAEEMANFSGRTLVSPTDVRLDEQVELMVERTVASFGRVDVLVNNAGLSLKASLSEGNIENQRYLWEVNYWGYVRCMRAVVPHMRRQRTGVVVNVSSVASRIAIPFEGTYSATKAAVASLSDSLRMELAVDGIKVITVYPGLTKTDLVENTIKEMALSPTSRLLRQIPARSVAKTVVKATRRGQRETYASWGDRAGILIKEIAPRLVDWGVSHLYLAERSPMGKNK